MKRMIRAGVNPELFDWTAGTAYEGNKHQLAYDIVAAREAALASNDIAKWIRYKEWVSDIYSNFTNVFDSIRDMEEWALVRIKYNDAR